MLEMVPSALLSIPQLAGPRVVAPRAADIVLTRAMASIAFVAAYTLAGFGLYWDIIWHTYLGRDTFLTPPHVLLYAGVALGGLAALASILYETFADHDDDEQPLLGGIRGLRGMFVAGAGVVVTVLAAPLDNQWHELYGLDVTIWAPFHLMGLFGALISLVGISYALASVANAVRNEAKTWLGYNLYEWLLLYTLATMVSLLIILVQPGLRIVPVVGNENFSVLPTPLLAAGPLTFLFAAAGTYAKRAAAPLVVLAIYLIRQSIFAVLAPVWTAALAASYHIPYRVAGFEPRVTASTATLLLALVPGAALVAFLYHRNLFFKAYGALAAVAFALGTAWWVASAQGVNIPLPVVAPPLSLERLLMALPLTLIVSAGLGVLAWPMARGFGTLLRAE